MGESKIESDGLLLNVAHGPRNGPPLLMFHGITRCWQDFWPLLPALTARYEVMALDFRGHGKSGAAQSYFVTNYVADATAALRALGKPGCILYGHSLGAMVAAAMAAAEPDFVRAIVLEDPPFHTMGRRIEQTAFKPLFEGMRRALLLGRSVKEIARQLSEIVLPSPDGAAVKLGSFRDASSLRFSAAALSRMDPHALTPLLAGTWLNDYKEEHIFSNVKCPVLLLQADEKCGGAFTTEDCKRLTDLLSQCSWVKFPECGHLIHHARPADVLTQVHSFLNSL